MIPILYEKTETEFKTLGIGPLSDAVSCEVTEERNGSYELRMTYPITGVHYSDIVNEAIICAIPADGADAQPFRIYKISRPINGKVSVYAEHLSYQLSHIVVMPFTAHGAGNTLSGLIDNSIGDQPFSVWTDIANGTTEYNQTVPASFRSRLGGVSGSVLDCFGGEYEFDQWAVKLHAHRGTDRGVSIEYGKNLVSVTQEENIANVVTGIVPMWKSNDGDTVVTLPEVLIESEYADRYTYKRNVVHDFSSDFQDQPTEEELREKAESYVSSNLIGVPEVSIDVDFVALADTEEYKDLERESINLCDTVTVRFAELGIDTKAKVIKTIYDVLGERYTKVSIGSVKASIVDTVNSIQQAQKEDSDTFKSFVASTLAKQKEIMTGGLGGHVIVNYVNGHPSEIVIGDTDNIETMKHCIVINKNGIGFSDGYNADVSSAWTIDGKFSADYILTGTLNAARIKAGIISDLLGRNYWNLETGEFSLTGYATDQELNDSIDGANDYTNQQAQGALDTAKSYSDTGNSNTLKSANSYSDTSAQNAVNAQTQDFIFNKLTNNGTVKGIILTDGKLYINADYITSGILNANLLRAGIIKSSKNNNNYWNLDTGELSITGYATDNELSSGVSDAKSYASTQAKNALGSAKSYSDTGDSNTLSSAKSYADTSAQNAVNAQTQASIFNKLTNNGQTQGLYLQNGKIYLNLEYLVSKIIKGLSIFGSTITFGDEGATYRVQATYREESVSDGNNYYPKGVVFETFDSGACINNITDRFIVKYYSSTTARPKYQPLYISKGQTYIGVESTYGKGGDACFVATNREDDVTAGVFSRNTFSNGLAVSQSRVAISVNDFTNLGSYLGKIILNSNGTADFVSTGQLVVRAEKSANTFVQSIGGNVYLQSRTSDDASNNSYLYLYNDGKVFLNGSLNKYTYINGYPAVRVNGTYHDIFFQWNGASLIATVDVTQVWSTSDRRLKDQIETIRDDYVDAIGSAEIKQFIFTDEIYDKSIKHFGVIAQDIRDALEAKGINPEEIAVNNHFDRDGEEYYGIDKEEFLMARIAYDEKKIKELKNEISDLREQIKQIKEMFES